MPDRLHNPLDPRHAAPAAPTPVGRGPVPTGDIDPPKTKKKKRKEKGAPPEKSAPAPAAAGELFENGEADA